MTETTTELVQKFVSENENWYVDTYESYTGVGVETKKSFNQFISELEDRKIDFHIDGDIGDKHLVKVYR